MKIEIDGVEVVLDEGVDPAELDQGADSRIDDLIDWDRVARDAEGEDD